MINKEFVLHNKRLIFTMNSFSVTALNSEVNCYVMAFPTNLPDVAIGMIDI